MQSSPVSHQLSTDIVCCFSLSLSLMHLNIENCFVCTRTCQSNALRFQLIYNFRVDLWTLRRYVGWNIQFALIYCSPFFALLACTNEQEQLSVSHTLWLLLGRFFCLLQPSRLNPLSFVSRFSSLSNIGSDRHRESVRLSYQHEIYV